MKNLLLSGTNAAELVGVSAPTFYKMAREHETLAPEPSAGGAVVWSLQKIMIWIEDQESSEFMRRKRLIAKWEKEGDPDGVHP